MTCSYVSDMSSYVSVCVCVCVCVSFIRIKNWRLSLFVRRVCYVSIRRKEVMAQLYVCHVFIRMKKWWLSYMCVVCVVTWSYPCHDVSMCVRWLIHMCAMTHLFLWQCSWLIYIFTVSAWLVHMGWLRLVGSLKLSVSSTEYSLFCRALLQKRPIILRSLLIVATPYLCYRACICVAWLSHICDMTHSYIRHDSFIYVTRLIHICDMTHSYMWHDSYIYATWLVLRCLTCVHTWETWQSVHTCENDSISKKRLYSVEVVLACLTCVHRCKRDCIL